MVTKLYTAKEVADRLGVTSRTIHGWIAQGVFPNAYKLNPHSLTSPYRIPEEDIVALEEKRRESRPTTAEKE
jgi:excisionase family DNA binding protein